MQQVLINADFIEFIETTPDTMITLTTGKKLVVSETKETILERVIAYKRQVVTPMDR